MSATLQTFDGLVQAMCGALRDSYGSPIDVSRGSLALALMEASASTATWIQYLNLQVLASTRLATSSGSDIDSWVEDFGLNRLGAQPATGQVVMTSLNPSGSSAVILDGALVRSADGMMIYAVIGGPYTRAMETSSVSVTVQAQTPGPAGNIGPGEITLLGSAISGIDLVSNPLAFSNGAAAESDAALRSRFISYINSRAQATTLAIRTAVEAIELGVSCEILENVATDGTPVPGHFVVIVDDGSGYPSASLIGTTQQTVEAVRPLGSTFTVIGPQVTTATVELTLNFDLQMDFAGIVKAVSGMITSYVDSLSVGSPLRLSRVIALAYAASSSINNVSTVTLNGGTFDLGGEAGSVVRAGPVVIHAG